jgi:hypothetical protein
MINKDSKMINKNFSSKTQFAIKTLGITVLGGISMNVDGVSTETDLEDPLFPEWAIADIEGVVSTLEDMAALAVHFEISPIHTIGHVTIPGGMVEWEEDFPDVFTNLEQLYEEYAAALVEIIKNPPQEISEAEKANVRDRLNDFGYGIPEKKFEIESTQLEDLED